MTKQSGKASKKKQKTPVIHPGEGVTPERRKQLGGVTVEVIGYDAKSNASIKRYQAKLECVLDYYWRTRKIDDLQRDAGVMYRGIYLRVNNGPACKIFDGSFLSTDEQDDHEWRMVAHIECVERLDAARAMLTPAQDRVILRVCGHDEFCQSKSDRKALQRGLQKLTEFFHVSDKKEEKTSN